jgi:hypothetical protein
MRKEKKSPGFLSAYSAERIKNNGIAKFEKQNYSAALIRIAKITKRSVCFFPKN